MACHLQSPHAITQTNADFSVNKTQEMLFDINKFLSKKMQKLMGIINFYFLQKFKI